MEVKNVQIVSIEEIKVISDSYKNVKFVVKTEEAYPQFIEFQTSNEKADNFIKYNKVGQFVDVSFNLRGRQWTNPQGEIKTFNTLDAWKIFKAEQQEQAAAIPPTTDDLPY